MSLKLSTYCYRNKDDFPRNKYRRVPDCCSHKQSISFSNAYGQIYFRWSRVSCIEITCLHAQSGLARQLNGEKSFRGSFDASTTSTFFCCTYIRLHRDNKTGYVYLHSWQQRHNADGVLVAVDVWLSLGLPAGSCLFRLHRNLLSLCLESLYNGHK